MPDSPAIEVQSDGIYSSIIPIMIVILVAIMTITNDIRALLAQSDFLFASAAREAVGETLEQVPPLRAD